MTRKTILKSKGYQIDAEINEDGEVESYILTEPSGDESPFDTMDEALDVYEGATGSFITD